MADPSSSPRFSEAVEAYIGREHPAADLDTVLSGIFIQRAARLHQQLSETEALRDYGLGWNAFSALFVLLVYERLEAQRMSRLLGITRQAVSSLLTNLERRELIARETGEDRRTLVVSLTPRGRQLAESALRDQIAANEGAFASLDAEERAEFRHGLERLLTRPEAAGWRRRNASDAASAPPTP